MWNRSARRGSFSARTDGASRPCGGAMTMMTAPTTAMRRTVVSSKESFTDPLMMLVAAC